MSYVIIPGTLTWSRFMDGENKKKAREAHFHTCGIGSMGIGMIFGNIWAWSFESELGTSFSDINELYNTLNKGYLRDLRFFFLKPYEDSWITYLTSLSSPFISSSGRKNALDDWCVWKKEACMVCSGPFAFSLSLRSVCFQDTGLRLPFLRLEGA